MSSHLEYYFRKIEEKFPSNTIYTNSAYTNDSALTTNDATISKAKILLTMENFSEILDSHKRMRYSGQPFVLFILSFTVSRGMKRTGVLVYLPIPLTCAEIILVSNFDTRSVNFMEVAKVMKFLRISLPLSVQLVLILSTLEK